MTQFTLLPWNLSRLAAVAGKENTKYAITGVHLVVRPDGSYVAEATDTKVLARVTGTPQAQPNDFPAIPQLDAAPNGQSEAIVPAREWGRAFARPGRKPGANPVLEQTAVVIGKRLTTFAHTDLETVTCASHPNVEGRFPPAADVVPKKAVVFSVRIDPVQLAALLDVAAAFTTDELPTVTLEFQADAKGKPSATHPIVVRRKNADQEFVGLIVPLS
jgi:hypothetical protein